MNEVWWCCAAGIPRSSSISLFQIWLVLHDIPARAFLYQVFGKVGDFVVLFHQRFYCLSSRVDFLESRDARCLDWFNGLSLALSNLCDLLLGCLRNSAFSELGIVSQLRSCVVKLSNRFLKNLFPYSVTEASAMIFPFSLSAASSSKITSWLLCSVTMQRWQTQHWHWRQ